MKPGFFLPSGDDKELSRALAFHHRANRQEHVQHSFQWTRTHWFLQGVRKLRIRTGFGDAIMAPAHTDEEGQLRIRVEKSLEALQIETGRILGIDLSPAVVRPPGIGLDGVRRTAVTQAALDNWWSRFNHIDFQTALAYLLTAYGTAGIGAFETPGKFGGIYGANIQLVAPWELKPLPYGITNTDDISGIEWHRWVPVDWVKDFYSDVLQFPKTETDLLLTEGPIGSKIYSEFAPIPNQGVSAGAIPLGLGSSTINRMPPGRVSPETQATKYVDLRQYWVYGSDYSCTRWIVTLGDHVALDVDYTDEKQRAKVGLKGNELPVAPLHVARYLTVGSFWGRGLLDRVEHLNRYLELLLGDMVQDMRDVSRLRMLAIPTSSGINVRNFKAYQKDRILPFTPDYAAPTLRPDIINPPVVGESHGKAAGFLLNLMQSSVMQGEMYRGDVPGRMDTAAGVSVIAEQQGIPFVPISDSIAGAMQGVYKSLAGILRRQIPIDQPLTISRIDESIVGVNFDRETGTIQLSDVPIPPPQELNITIRSKAPRPKKLIEAQLKELLGMQVITPIQFRIAAIREGLDLPLVNRAEYENYATAWMENVIMFGDGQTPGQTITNEDADNHPIHFAVLMEFMGSYLWRLASTDVRQAFIDHKNYHLMKLGGFPQGLENVDQFGQVGPPAGGLEGLLPQGLPPGNSNPMEALMSVPSQHR